MTSVKNKHTNNIIIKDIIKIFEDYPKNRHLHRGVSNNFWKTFWISMDGYEIQILWDEGRIRLSKEISNGREKPTYDVYRNLSLGDIERLKAILKNWNITTLYAKNNALKASS